MKIKQVDRIERQWHNFRLSTLVSREATFKLGAE